jgi:hypothetical protein
MLAALCADVCVKTVLDVTIMQEVFLERLGDQSPRG